jgi:hypothetical protein
MQRLELKATHKLVQNHAAALRQFDSLGYARNDILFQTPRRALLFQNDTLGFDADLTQPRALIDAFNVFFSYTPPAYTEWERAVREFQDRVPEVARSLMQIIERERKTNRRFIRASYSVCASNGGRVLAQQQIS